jgi:microcystin-dependent protein
MSEPYIGEIKMTGFGFAPMNWALCDGQILEVNNHSSLFVLIGNTYGGDGEETFALPDLCSRVPIHQGNGYFRGQKGGVETVTLTTEQLPSHSHSVNGISKPGNKFAPGSDRCPASAQEYQDLVYANSNSVTPMANGIIAETGGGGSHYNVQPSLGIYFSISLEGLFPQRPTEK